MKYAKRWSIIYGKEKYWARGQEQEQHPDRLLLRKIVKLPVIDVGCGTGLDVKFYEDYVGIDVTPEFIKSARRKYNDARLVLCDARYLPFRDKVFKTAFSKGVVIHYPQEDGEKMLHDMIRISNITYIAWGIPIIGPGRGENYLPSYTSKFFVSNAGFHVNRYDLKELEKNFKIYPLEEGTSVTLIREKEEHEV